MPGRAARGDAGRGVLEHHARSPGRRRAARRPAGRGPGAGLPFSTWSEVTSTSGSGRPAAASRARASGAVHDVAIATRGSDEHVGRAGHRDDAVGVGGLRVGEHRGVLLDLRRRGTCSAITARAGRPWLPAWIASPSSPWRSPHARQLRTVGALESISTPSRSEMTATNVSSARLTPRRRRGGRARTPTTAPRISVASAHDSDTASASTPMIGGPIEEAERAHRGDGGDAGAGGHVGLAAGGAEHQRHAVGDAEADHEQPDQRRRRAAPISSIAASGTPVSSGAPAQRRRPRRRGR